MKRLIACLLCAALCCFQANAAGWLPLAKSSGGGVAFSITNTDKKADTSSGTVITYNAGGNPSIGATNGGNRIIVITLSGQGFGGGITSCTVNGVAATPKGTRFDGVAGAAQFYISDSAAGTSALTSAAVVITYTGTVNSSEIGVYVVTTSTPSQTPLENDNANFAPATSIAATVTIPAGGGGIAVATLNDNGTATSVSWTGMTADYNDSVGGLNNIQASGVHTTSTGSTTFTANFSSVPDSFLVATSWAP